MSYSVSSGVLLAWLRLGIESIAFMCAAPEGLPVAKAAWLLTLLIVSRCLIFLYFQTHGDAFGSIGFEILQGIVHFFLFESWFLYAQPQGHLASLVKRPTQDCQGVLAAAAAAAQEFPKCNHL